MQRSTGAFTAPMEHESSCDISIGGGGWGKRVCIYVSITRLIQPTIWSISLIVSPYRVLFLPESADFAIVSVLFACTLLLAITASLWVCVSLSSLLYRFRVPFAAAHLDLAQSIRDTINSHPAHSASWRYQKPLSSRGLSVLAGSSASLAHLRDFWVHRISETQYVGRLSLWTPGGRTRGLGAQVLRAFNRL